jgi:hypothetical protein
LSTKLAIATMGLSAAKTRANGDCVVPQMTADAATGATLATSGNGARAGSAGRGGRKSGPAACPG